MKYSLYVLWLQGSEQGIDPNIPAEASLSYLYMPREHAHGLSSKLIPRKINKENIITSGQHNTQNFRRHIRPTKQTNTQFTYVQGRPTLVVMNRSSLLTSPDWKASERASPTSVSFLQSAAMLINQ